MKASLPVGEAPGPPPTAIVRERWPEARYARRPTLTSWLLHLTTRAPRLQSRASRLHAWLVRTTGGRVLGRWVGGAPVLVLETIGRRSGRRRRTPVVFTRDRDRFVVTAANAGAGRTPAWFLNLRERGSATVVLGKRRIAVRAELATGQERRRLWHLLHEMVPAIAEYSAFTDRRFPIVTLAPAREAAATGIGEHERRSGGASRRRGG